RRYISGKAGQTSGIRTPTPDTMIHNAENNTKTITQRQAVDPGLGHHQHVTIHPSVDLLRATTPMMDR
ncbi:MAG: hypothetical protein ACRDRU_09775, partial [Pseudonocardiaceae bacterium]